MSNKTKLDEKGEVELREVEHCLSKKPSQSSISLKEHQSHSVWKPEHRETVKSVDIKERRKQLQNRVYATQQVLRQQSEDVFEQELADGALKKKNSTASLPFHDLVSRYATSHSSSVTSPTFKIPAYESIAEEIEEDNKDSYT